MTSPWRQRGRAFARGCVMPAVYVGFTMLVFYRVWSGIDGAEGFWRFDPRFEYWGDLSFQVDTLRQGQLAMWNPYDRGGFPLYGDPQPGLLYPGNWPLVLWGLISGGTSHMLIAVKILGHWVFGLIGMHLFLRRLGAREPACYLGAALFGFTCPRMRYGGSALNWSAAWIPWVLLALDWFAERPSPRRGIVLGSAFAMVLLTGAPAVMLYTLLIAVPFGLWRLRGRLRASWKPIAIAAGVAALWLAPLVLSNLEQVPESVRQQRNLSFIANSAFGPVHLVGLLVPRISDQNLYFGLLALFAIAVAVVSDRRTLVLVLLGVAAAGVALAFGNHAGILPASASAVPVFGFFRQAHRYIYITAIAIPIIAALGVSYAYTVQDPATRKALGRWITAIGGATTFALGLTLLIAVVVSKDLRMPKNDALALGFVSAAVSTWLLRSIIVYHGRTRTTFAWIATVVVALDVWTANAKMVDAGWTPPPIPKHDAALAQLEGVEREWRIYDRGYLDFRPGTRLGIRDFGGYEDDPLGLSRQKTLFDATRSDLRLLGHANVRYFLDGGNRHPPLAPKPRDGFDKLPGAPIWELPVRAPAVMYVPDAELVDGPKQALARLRTLEPGTGAVVEGPAPPRGPPGATVVAGRVLELEPNRFVAEIETPGPGLVVIAEA
ncbi:MAG TPA: hypothetical protein VML75_24475, partial [Kofleriaceae bacterium]|nr:hypothetical protein [Kofleriaceae bacterium]